MQHIAYIEIDDEEYTVLVRKTKYGVALKLAASKVKKAKLVHLPDEQAYLNDNPQLIEALKRGEVVQC